MNHLNKQISKLRQRKQKERQRLNKKYNKLIEKIQQRCTEHEFGNWDTRPDNIHGGFQTNLFGDPILFRKCKICGKTEEYVDPPKRR